MSPTSTFSDNAPRPDDGGSEGKRTVVNVNLFAIQKLPADTIYQYDVNMKPELPPKRARLLWQAMENIPPLLSTKTVFDGRAIAFAARKLNLGESTISTFEVALPHKGSSKQNIFQVQLQFVNMIDLTDLNKFLRREGPLTPAATTFLQALNTLLQHKALSTFPSAGQSIFPSGEQIELGRGVALQQGIFQSVRVGQGRLYSNVDVANMAFYRHGNAIEVMTSVINRQPNPSAELHQADLQRVTHHFKSLLVETVHRSGNNRKYRVASVSPRGASQTSFTLNDGNNANRLVTVAQYFHEQYAVRLAFPHLPCFGIKSLNGSTMYFPMEVCSVLSGQKYTRKLSEDQTATMIRYACQKPEKRKEIVLNNRQALDFDHNEYLNRFGVSVSSEMAIVPARILAPPVIVHKPDLPTVKPAAGSWSPFPGNGFFKGAALHVWSVLVLDSQIKVSRTVVETFIRELVVVMLEMGMRVSNRQPYIRYENTQSKMDQVLRTVWEITGNQANQQPQLIIVIIPTKSSIYGEIKAFSELHSRWGGIMTQCVTSGLVALKPKKQVLSQLSLKINTKLGGVNAVLQRGEMTFVTSSPTMVFGADVSHPTSSETSRPSYAAVVASMDMHATRYCGRLKAQVGQEEVIMNLESMVADLVQTFLSRTSSLPGKIIFYRDGVSEGQFAEILRMECTAIKKACAKVDPKCNPALTFVVVKKRHHLRMFPTNRGDSDRSGNVMSGAVIDSVVTHPTEFDFLLQSHGGLQGTSRPSLYHVLFDENKFTSDGLQSLSYKLCHLSARCTKAISIVPPVYYAHLLAHRARHYNPSFEDSSKSSVSGAPLQKSGTSQHEQQNQDDAASGLTLLPDLRINRELRDAMFFV